MSVNSFGRLLKVTTWGESHGPAIGAVVDGCPPGLTLSESDIQPWLDKRRPGTSRHSSQRREPDTVRILSGTYDGQTTGAPISLMIDNVDARPKDYAKIAGAFRPSHADFTIQAKYGVRDPRGGGRASARETACRVAAGAIARLIIPTVAIQGYLVELGGSPIDRAMFDVAEVERNAFFSPDAGAVRRWEKMLDDARKSGTSLGAIAEVVARGVPAGWGAPTYAKLDADLAGAAMSINAVKGVEIGDGFAAARLKGHQNADELRAGAEDRPAFLSNHAGGILGGISTGQNIVMRVAFKPTPSIPTPLRTVDRDGAETHIRTTGRHDPCVGIRGVPVVEAMMALVLADHMLLDRAICGKQR
jgi:chorismate synthase